MRRYLTHAEVAIALGVSPQWLYRNKRRLEREHGFPEPAPGMRGDGGNLYDPKAITLWQDGALERTGGVRQTITVTLPPSIQPDAEDQGDAVAELLDSRARALAGRIH